jgi:hypothetical protein
MFISTLVFLILNSLLLPLAYFKGILVKIQFLSNIKSETPLRTRILSLIIFIFLGWAIVFLNLAMDIYVFIVHLYQKKISYRKEKPKVQFISIKTYNQLLNKFERDTKDRIEVVAFIELSEYVREMMEVTKLIRAIIFRKHAEEIDFNKQVFFLQEYGKVKKALDNGAVKLASQRLVFPSIWRYLMTELKINSRIRSILRQKETSEKEKVSSFENMEQKDYLRQFLNISIGEVHQAIKKTQVKEIRMEGNLSQ